MQQDKLRKEQWATDKEYTMSKMFDENSRYVIFCCSSFFHLRVRFLSRTSSAFLTFLTFKLWLSTEVRRRLRFQCWQECISNPILAFPVSRESRRVDSSHRLKCFPQNDHRLGWYNDTVKHWMNVSQWIHLVDKHSTVYNKMLTVSRLSRFLGSEILTNERVRPGQ